MDGSQKKKGFDTIITAIKTGAGIAASALAANKSKSASVDAARIEKSISELNSKFDRIAEQLKNVHPEASTATKEAEKKPASAQPHNNKPQQDIIYVRKSSEFSFYN